MHVHAVKGNAECKYWLDPDAFALQAARATHRSYTSRRCATHVIDVSGCVVDDVDHTPVAHANAAVIPVASQLPATRCSWVVHQGQNPAIDALEHCIVERVHPLQRRRLDRK